MLGHEGYIILANIGAKGQLGIRLSRAIYPSAISIEHVPKSVALDGMQSAIRNGELWVVYSDTMVLVNEFMFDVQGDSIQTFYISSEMRKEVEERGKVLDVVVKIKSNWGHEEWTCLYRVRVHGKEVKG